MLLQSYESPLLNSSVPNSAASLYDALQSKQTDYDVTEKYLHGDHELRFATEKFTNAFGGLFRAFCDNYMKRVVSALSDYLQLDTVEVAEKAAQKGLADWWEKQRLQVQSGRIHQDAFGYGNGYAIVAKNLKGELRIYRQSPRQVTVVYDPEEPERIILAVKVWQQLDKRWRLNVYEREKTSRLVSEQINRQSAPGKITSFVPYTDDGSPEVRNDLGIVPVFHFANEPDNAGQGHSELDDLIPLQDGLNKSVMDMLVAMEFQAYRQRWATGIEVKTDEDTGLPIQPFHGADRLWIAQQATDDQGKPVPVQFGEFGIVDLQQFLKVSESFRTEIARLSRLPLHHLMMTGDFPSGEALKTAEGPLIAKVRDRQMSWGNVWEDVADYVMLYERIASPGRSRAVWTDTAPQSAAMAAAADLAESQALAEKVDNLFISVKQARRDLGLTDQQSAQMDKEIEEESAQRSRVQINPAVRLSQPPSKFMPIGEAATPDVTPGNG